MAEPQSTPYGNRSKSNSPTNDGTSESPHFHHHGSLRELIQTTSSSSPYSSSFDSLQTPPVDQEVEDKVKDKSQDQDDDLVSTPLSPDVLVSHGQSLIASSAIRHVKRVSKQAALNTKRQIWDSNDASIVAAQSAVNQWEQGYNGLRGLLFAIGDSAKGLYGAAKAGASGLEHGLLVPVRDWVLLPAFGGVEKIAGETVGFLHSDQAKVLAHNSLDLARQVPFVGENLLAPGLCIGVDVLKKTWEIAQYPIPSPVQVRDSVDFVMTGTKWALSSAGREVFLYAKRADANITRTLSHTRWKVLGSGPYATLDKLNKREVLDHLCERYFSLSDPVARYEWAAHVRAHNRPLYHDMVLTGLLRERGGDLTAEDEWLSSCPSYRDSGSIFLLEEEDEVFPLWFRLPYENGKRPRGDTPWIAFDESERKKLERYYLNNIPAKSQAANRQDQPLESKEDGEPINRVSADKFHLPKPRFSTSAQWYDPDPIHDLLLDSKRHAVSAFPCCPNCRRRHDWKAQAPLVHKQFGEICDDCAKRQGDAPWVNSLLSTPPISMVYRPTMWRFYGPGDELRRATWFLDTQRHGPQPYGEDAQAVLEDAYLFLKWTAKRRVWDDDTLLTVQVPSPDGGELQLVQFSSLTSATAIGKGLGSAISLFKRRVYRGAHHGRNPIEDPDDDRSVLDVVQEDARYSVDDISSSNFEQNSTPTMEQALEPPSAASQDRTVMSSSTPLHDEYSPSDWVDLRVLEGQKDDRPNHKSIPTILEDESTVVSGKLSSSMSADTGIAPHDSDKGILAIGEQMVAETENAMIDAMNVYTNEIKNLRIRLSQPLDEHLLLAYPLKKPDKDSEHTHDQEILPIDEDENDSSDDIDHLVLIVHGIGEMLQTIDFFGLSKIPTIVDCCANLRKNHAEVLEVRFNQLYKKNDEIGTHRLGPGRVEYLPIEWHDSFTVQSHRRLLASRLSQASMATNYNINDISLRTIPQLRQFANDTLLDVLYFMSPEHHDIIVDIVVDEMNYVVERFRALTGFKGEISLIGHSLGSIIAWDILDNQRGFRKSLRHAGEDCTLEDPISTGVTPPMSTSSNDGEDSESFKEEAQAVNACKVENDLKEKDGFSEKLPHQHPEQNYPQLSFTVDNAFMLGSPIAVFLMMRNQRQPLSLDYKLNGCSRIFNIFHPFDPVAYRIEPLLDARNKFIEPKIMTHWHGGFRFQYQTKRLWKKIVQETVKTQENVVASLESGIAALGLLDGHEGEDDNHDDDGNANAKGGPNTIATGNLNRGYRIDYMLQEKELESANEYVAALAAHSCYWLEKDLSLFIARQIRLRELEREDMMIDEKTYDL